MYLVYEENYGDCLCETDAANIVGLFKTKEKAMEKVKERIELGKQEHYVLDEEANFEEDNCCYMFWQDQENWNEYYAIILEKIEVE